MLNYPILLNKISKTNNLLYIKDIINSVNDNQLKNKEWLIKKLKPYLDIYTSPKIAIAAGWHGLLAHLLNDKENIYSFDIDGKCKEIKLFNNVSYKTSNILKHNPVDADFLICTSCEHITDDNILTWIKRKKPDSMAIIQSNDYFGIDGHINCKKSLTNFKRNILAKSKQKKMNIQMIDSFELRMPRYTRFMLFLS